MYRVITNICSILIAVILGGISAFLVPGSDYCGIAADRAVTVSVMRPASVQALLPSSEESMELTAGALCPAAPVQNGSRCQDAYRQNQTTGEPEQTCGIADHVFSRSLTVPCRMADYYVFTLERIIV